VRPAADGDEAGQAADPPAAGGGPGAAGEVIGPWRRHARRVAYANDWISVYHDEVARPDGSLGIYGVVHFENVAVGVVAIDANDRVALVGQHRYPLDIMSWEIPEGGSPHDEDSLVGAQRELREETGLVAGTWQVIGRYHLSNSVSDEEAVLYLATDLRPGPAAPEATEELVIRWLDFADALAMVGSGEITDAMSALALQQVALARC